MLMLDSTKSSQYSPAYGKFATICWNIFCFCYLHIIWSNTNTIFQKKTQKTVQQRAARNLAVSVTYQEWLGRLCGLLLLAAHNMKAMRPRDHCTAVAPPYPPFCSRNNERLLAAAMWIKNGLTFTCVINSNNIRRSLHREERRPISWLSRLEMHASGWLIGSNLNFSLKDSLLF